MSMEYKRLSEVVDIISGYAIPSDCMTDVGVPILKITNIKEDNTLDLINTSKYNKPITPKLKKFILKSKDILVCMTGATIGKVARCVNVQGEYIVNQRVAIIRPINEDDADHIYYILSSSTFRRYVELVGYGAAQPNISATAIGKFCFEYNPIANARKKIGDALSSYDNLIELNTRRIKVLEQMAENLYKEWFVRFRFPGYQTTTFENGIPKGWRKGQLGEICEFKRGKNITSDEMCAGNVPVIAAGLEPSGYHNKANVFGTSITMSSSGANAGYISIHFQDIWAADCSYVDTSITPYIFYAYELLNNLRTVINNLQRGAAQPHVYAKDVNSLKLLIPNEELVSMANEKLKPIFDEIAQLQLHSANLTRQRDLLLPRLMSGQLQPPTQ